MSLHEDDLPGYLVDAINSGRERGLREMRVHLVGTHDPQWQVSSRFVGSSGYHIAMGPELGATLLEALTPPTGAKPLAKPGPAPSASLPAVGLFD